MYFEIIYFLYRRKICEISFKMYVKMILFIYFSLFQINLFSHKYKYLYIILIKINIFKLFRN